MVLTGKQKVYRETCDSCCDRTARVWLSINRRTPDQIRLCRKCAGQLLEDLQKVYDETKGD